MALKKQPGRGPRRNAYSPERVRDWQASGLTKTEYGRRNGIHPNVLSRWIARHSEEEGCAFVRIEPGSLAPDSGPLEIVLPDGIRIRGVDGTEISAILKAIRGL